MGVKERDVFFRAPKMDSEINTMCHSQKIVISELHSVSAGAGGLFRVKLLAGSLKGIKRDARQTFLVKRRSNHGFELQYVRPRQNPLRDSLQVFSDNSSSSSQQKGRLT